MITKYLYLDGSIAYRGCLSDTDTGRDYCTNNPIQCSTCKKRACNDNSLTYEVKFSCVKCNPKKDDNCDIIDKNITAIECAPTALGYSNQCYTYQKENETYRGCLYEAPGDIFTECSDDFSESCLTCNNTDCNRKPIENDDLTVNAFHYDIHDVDHKTMFIPCGNDTCDKINSWQRYCWQCDSRIDPNCKDTLGQKMLGLCPYAKEDLGCYHMITGMFLFSFYH